MPYRIAALSSFETSLRKLTKKNKPLRDLIAGAVEDVSDDPSIGEPYHGNLFGLYKFKFDHYPNPSRRRPRHRRNRPEYRLVYAPYDCCGNIDSCQYADVELAEGETECSGLVEFIDVFNRADATKLYKKDASYIRTLLR